jgi:hypothetical protein
MVGGAGRRNTCRRARESTATLTLPCQLRRPPPTGTTLATVVGRRGFRIEEHGWPGRDAPADPREAWHVIRFIRLTITASAHLPRRQARGPPPTWVRGRQGARQGNGRHSAALRRRPPSNTSHPYTTRCTPSNSPYRGQCVTRRGRRATVAPDTHTPPPPPHRQICTPPQLWRGSRQVGPPLRSPESQTKEVGRQQDMNAHKHTQTYTRETAGATPSRRWGAGCWRRHEVVDTPTYRPERWPCPRVTQRREEQRAASGAPLCILRKMHGIGGPWEAHYASRSRAQ